MCGEVIELDLAKLKAALSPDVCGVYVENPNFFGRFEEQLEEIRALTNGVLVVGVNPIAHLLGLRLYERLRRDLPHK